MRLFFKGFKRGTYYFGELISILVNTVLLFIVYFFVVGLTATFARIVGKKFLQAENSEWSDINEKQLAEENFYRQF